MLLIPFFVFGLSYRLVHYSAVRISYVFKKNTLSFFIWFEQNKKRNITFILFLITILQVTTCIQYYQAWICCRIPQIPCADHVVSNKQAVALELLFPVASLCCQNWNNCLRGKNQEVIFPRQLLNSAKSIPAAQGYIHKKGELLDRSQNMRTRAFATIVCLDMWERIQSLKLDKFVKLFFPNISITYTLPVLVLYLQYINTMFYFNVNIPPSGHQNIAQNCIPIPPSQWRLPRIHTRFALVHNRKRIKVFLFYGTLVPAL